MDSMEFNKIAAAGLASLLVFLLLNFFSGLIYGTREHAGDAEHGPVLAYAVAIDAAETGAPAEEEQVDLLALFEQPDVEAGERVFRACGACHALEPGVNKVGPTLYDVVGADIAHVEGFAYSDVLAGMEGEWTAERLSDFLADPRDFAPGTKMSFAGLDDPADRANVIAYLNEVGDTPVDLTEGLEPLAPAAPEAAPEAAEETTEDAATASTGDEVERTGTEIVDPGEEGVEVESTTPLEIEEADPPPAGEQGSEPVDEAEEAEAPEAEAPTDQGEGEDAGEQLAVAPPAEETAMPAGDAAAGERLFRRCQACHKLEEGAHAVGPSLHDIVGRDIAAAEDYGYSDAMAAQEGVWTPELLSAYIEDPNAVVPGTKMAFAGLRDEQDRIDLITYLREAAQ